MLEKIVKSRQELLDALDNVEMLGFPFQVEGRQAGKDYEYRLLIGGAEAAAAVVPAVVPEIVEPARKRKLKSPMQKRTAEQIIEHNIAISEFLRGRSGSTSTGQIYKEMKLRGHDWKQGSTSGIIQRAMKADPNIIQVVHGMYSYRREMEV